MSHRVSTECASDEIAEFEPVVRTTLLDEIGVVDEFTFPNYYCYSLNPKECAAVGHEEWCRNLNANEQEYDKYLTRDYLNSVEELY